ncbi:hypothetical protein BJX70DRAFT_107926 [Aspergillus crustosus]
MATPPALSTDGYEMQFATNHLGHALLIHRLLPTLQRTTTEHASGTAATGRIAILSSVGYALHPCKGGGVDFATLNTVQDTGLFGSWFRYGQSKLANTLYAQELATRLAETRVTCVAVHPGIVATGLVEELPWVKRAFVYVGTLGKVAAVEDGVRNTVWAATVAREGLVNGGFDVGVGELGKLDTAARDSGDQSGTESLAARLWRWTERAIDEWA